jgi:hypothetical protein
MIVLGNVGGLMNLILFVFLLTFLASIFASQLLRGELPYQEDANVLPVSFFTIYNSFIGMYQILSSENWTTILYSVTSNQEAFHSSWIGASFCILWFIFANCRLRSFTHLGCTNHLCSHRSEHVYCCHSRELRRFGG